MWGRQRVPDGSFLLCAALIIISAFERLGLKRTGIMKNRRLGMAG
jgi:hypothetical protein